MIPNVLTLPGLVMLGCLTSLTANAGVAAQWSYVGSASPSHWGMLDPAYELCDTGKSQSPVNLDRKKVRVPYALKIHYPNVVSYISKGGHWVQLNAAIGAKDYVTYNGKEFKLLELHFHSPSETLWHKETYPLEIHFVNQSKDKQLLVVAVFVDRGSENQSLQFIDDNVEKARSQELPEPEVPNQANLKTDGEKMTVNLAQLLPTDQRYYSFNGSLTTPPCNEGVQWIVMTKPITASPAEISKMREEIGGSNARPVQPLNGRVLNYSVE
jgi:carbonic anhydrase